jgi:hypothetical protein
MNSKKRKAIHNNTKFPINYKPCCSCLEKAVENGCRSCIGYLHFEECESWNMNHAILAIENDHFDCLKYLHENGCPLDEEVFDMAIEKGDLRMVEYLFNIKCPIDSEAFLNAIKYEHLDILKYIINKNQNDLYDKNDDIYHYVAMETGSLEIVKFLIDEGFVMHCKEAIYEAIENDYKELWKYSLNHLFDGNYEYYMNELCVIDKSYIVCLEEIFITEKDDIQLLKEFHELLSNYNYFNEPLYKNYYKYWLYVSETGNMDMLKYLMYEHQTDDITQKMQTIEKVVNNYPVLDVLGAFDVLECKYPVLDVLGASDVLESKLMDIKVNFSDIKYRYMKDIYENLIENEHHEMLKYLFHIHQKLSILDFDEFIYTNELPCLAVYYGNLECLKFFHNNGCKLDEDVFESAHYGIYEGYYRIQHYVQKNHIDCIKYLFDNDCKYYECNDIFVHPYYRNIVHNQVWFQKHMYIKTGEVNKKTLHIHHKVIRIQRAWIKYSLNPRTSVGNKKMMSNIHAMEKLLIC